MDSSDSLDRKDFDPVAYVNQHFPTEASLKRLEPFLARVDSNITQLDEEISRAVQAQAEAGERAAKDISEAKGAIHELHAKIKDIKSKADQSELMVGVGLPMLQLNVHRCSIPLSCQLLDSYVDS